MENKQLAYEIELKVKKNKKYKTEIVDDDFKVYDFMKKIYGNEILIYESSYILMCNSQLQIIGYGLISKGDSKCTCVDVKTICKFCVDTMCVAAIFVHNHPSGDLRPSRHDDDITKRIKESLNIFGIKLIDSVIVTDNNFYSYRRDDRI